MRNINKLLLLAGILLLSALLCGCGTEHTTLGDMETVVYSHPNNGACLTVPAEWEMLSETDEAVVFANADNTLSLGVIRELAGFSYYSADGLAELGEELAAAAFDGGEITTLERELLKKPENAVLVTVTGQVGGANAVSRVVVLSPLSAVRYFIVATATSDAFAEYDGVLRDIYATFDLSMTEDEIYEQIPE